MPNLKTPKVIKWLIFLSSVCPPSHYLFQKAKRRSLHLGRKEALHSLTERLLYSKCSVSKVLLICIINNSFDCWPREYQIAVVAQYVLPCWRILSKGFWLLIIHVFFFLLLVQRDGFINFFACSTMQLHKKKCPCSPSQTPVCLQKTSSVWTYGALAL